VHTEYGSQPFALAHEPSGSARGKQRDGARRSGRLRALRGFAGRLDLVANPIEERRRRFGFGFLL